MRSGLALRALAVIIVMLTATTARADDSGYCGANGNNVTWSYNSNSKTLTISGSGAMANYSSFVKPWINNIESIETVVIEDGVTSIGNYAFAYCSNLTSVTIPSSVTSIGEYVFFICTRLTSVTIPSSVTSIGGGAFDYCSSLTSITIPSSVTSIEKSTFAHCESLTSINIPANVTSIGEDAFYFCLALETITIDEGNDKYDSRDECNAIIETVSNTLIYGCKKTVIPNSVTSIGEKAFYFCEGMTSVTIPSSVTSIGKTAFLGCTGLASVTIPSSVTTIGELAFNRCQSLTSVTIPSSVTTIESYAFSECTGLSSVTIPSSVTSIEERTFLACSSLTSVTIPSSVTNIGNSAFEGCTSLKSVIIPSSVTSIGEDAFDHCTSLSSVTIPSSVTSIEPYVFRNCTSLSSITIPASVTSIGNSAFEGCTSLKSIFMLANSTVDDTSFDFNVQGKKFYVPSGSANNYSYYFYGSDIIEFDGYCGDPDVNGGKNVAWVLTDEDGDSENVKETLTICGTGAMKDYVYYNIPWLNNRESIKTVVVGNGVTSIGSFTSYDCNNLTSVTIPSSVTSISERAFENCSKLTSIIIPSSITSIEDRTFFGCSSLTSIIIPSSVTSIGNSAFSHCESLTSINIPANVTSIGKNAFYYCLALVTITIDEGNDKYDSRDDCNAIIETTSNTLIYGCKKTVIPNSVKSIGDYAFYYCKGLTSVTIPSSVTSIGKSAFSYAGLTSINIPSSVKSIGTFAFNNCSGLTSVVIPSSVTNIEDGTFFYCIGLTSVTIPSSVTSIGESAFSYAGLTSISIPSSVTSIGNNAFLECINLTDVYCYANPESLTWYDFYCDDFIYDDENPAKTTVCHVAGSKLATFLSKWSKGDQGTDINVIFMGDGIEPGGVDYLVETKTYKSGTAPEGVKTFLPVAYDLSTATVTLAEVTGAPKGMPVIYGSAKVDEKMPDLFFLNYVADDSDDATAIQNNYDSKANAMSDRFVITDGKDNLFTILGDIDGVTASDAIFFVLANGKFTRVSVSADDLDKEANPAKPGLLLFVLSKWEYMNMGSASSGSTNAARGIGIGEGGATAIDNGKLIIDNWAGAQWYDLQGRKIAEPTRKGLYIRNGVKVVVK